MKIGSGNAIVTTSVDLDLEDQLNDKLDWKKSAIRRDPFKQTLADVPAIVKPTTLAERKQNFISKIEKEVE